jgi:hypothetical protein
VLVWTGGARSAVALPRDAARAPHAPTPPHLAEKILTTKSTLEGERKQVTVLFMACTPRSPSDCPLYAYRTQAAMGRRGHA